MTKSLPFDENIVTKIISEFGSPVYVYDEAGIRNTSKELYTAFAWAKDYKNYFAVKATPTPGILKILQEEGMGFDVSSRSELLTVQRLGIPGDQLFYTANNVSKEDFALAIELGATVNIDDLSQLDVFLGLIKDRGYGRVSCRYTPLSIVSGGNDIIGAPREAKYGMSLDNLFVAYKRLKEANIKSFCLHAMVVSNELNPRSFADTANLLKDAIDQIEEKCNIKIGAVNLGGGCVLNKKVDQAPLDLTAVSKEIETVFKDSGITIYTENGRFVTGPHGYLVTTVRYIMNKYKTYVGVDASMHNLMRPGMYGAYHHITVLGRDESRGTKTYDVVGSLCENNDKFAIDRELPECNPGDVMIIHDAGAHGHAMGFNYNGLLKSPEVLLETDGSYTLLRRAETVDDYFRTIVW